MAAAKASTSKTRKETEVWLAGQPLDKITGTKLPSKGDVLRRIFYLIRREKETVKSASKIVMQEVKGFWDIARIPTMADYHVMAKVEKEYNNWRALLKGRCRRSTPQINKEEVFTEELDDLFDIAHANALQLLTIDEDRQFLIAQREKGRRGYMAAVDQELAKQEARKQQEIQAYERRKRKHEEESAKLSTTIELASSSSDEDDIQLITIPPEVSTNLKRKRGRKNIISPDVASALDRTQLSDRNAVFVLSAAATSLGHNIEDLAINRSTIRRTRIEERKVIADLLKESFDPKTSLIVHWDGKLLPDIIGNATVDRLPVLVSGGNIIKLLGVPKLLSGTGEAMATAVIDCLTDWNILNRIQGMSFDTTASNTGHMLGACTLIEKKIGRELLNLACRHHILEIVAEKVFTVCYNEISSGPNIKLFLRFQKQWDNIDKESFETIHDDVPNRDDIIFFCEQQLNVSQPRDDYRELLELTIIYLGGIPPRGIRFMQPGALHRARWMARIIYTIKICLFHQQFSMTKSEVTGLKRFAEFSVKLYIRYWFVAPLAVAAPANDLSFLKKMVSYEDKNISEAALKAFSRHQWYLSEILVSLAFFDPDTPYSVKREMVKALDKEGARNGIKRITLVDEELTPLAINQKSVASFVTKSSRHFFEMLNIPTEFLKFDPEEWDNRPEYKVSQQFLQVLKVVNDSAERGVALIQNYNSILTKNEDQKQYLLQVVEQHRQKFPNAKKVTILQSD